jgi:NADPH:quinone reductase-like Zn-dependent oxidoreductase
VKIQAPEIVPKGLPNSLRTPLDDLAAQIAAGTLHVQVGKVFRLDEIAEAHRCMGGEQGQLGSS